MGLGPVETRVKRPFLTHLSEAYPNALLWNAVMWEHLCVFFDAAKSLFNPQEVLC